MSNPQSTPPDDIAFIAKLSGAIITALLGAVGWLWRKALRAPRPEPCYENGKKLSRQDYISQLESVIETQRAIMAGAGMRLSQLEESMRGQENSIGRHSEQIERIEDDLTVIAENMRQAHQASLRAGVLQRSQDERLRAIQVIVERLDAGRSSA